MSFLGAFNTQLENFASSLTQRFPEDTDLKVAARAVSTLKSVNPKKNIEFFKAYVYCYKHIIEAKSDSFFLESDLLKEITANSSSLGVSVDSGEANMIISRLRTHWVSLTDEEKENIWKYLNVLIKLVEKYYS